MKKYNLGIIGAGMYGKILMRAFRKDERANILWVNSASEGTTKSAAEEFGVEKWSTDYHDVLNDPTVDVVIIATPPYRPRGAVGSVSQSGKTCFAGKAYRRIAGKPPANCQSR